MVKIGEIERPRLFFAGGAHVDRRARADVPFLGGASNPGTLLQAAGGAILNAATAWRALGGPATLWSARGGDADAALVQGAVEAAGIEDLSIAWLDRTTASYTAILDDRGDLVAGVADMAIYERLQPRHLTRAHLRPAIEACNALLVDANLPESTLLALAGTFAPERPTGAIGVSPAKVVRLRPALPRLDALFLSRAEAASLAHATPTTRFDLLAELLDEAGVKRAVITDGAGAALILDEDALLMQAPVAVQPRDVTGAGDTLAATAFGLFAAGLDFVQAVRAGMAAATIRIRDGALPDAPSFSDMIETLAAEMPPPEAIGERTAP
jgi:pseudouridine kinase